MSTIIKLIIVGLILHAVYRAGSAYWVYYKFEDQLKEVAQFGSALSEQALRDRAMELASSLKVPIESEQVVIRRGMGHTVIDASYKTDIEVFPRYQYPWEFHAHVDVLSIEIPKPSDLLPAQ